ncbi:ABC transporter permease [Actinomadura macrotermitis]|uniref:Uncharacterized protein n=1 Tax=Actinomadura macrotermitis TaxID=2585200 RepID=A0A7K0C501_9ACTN|nr:ABC transporter permease [Actinomadura macrotermitis]MQY08527.1 hypothetical protein [Actinomadura macrotermitis]
MTATLTRPATAHADLAEPPRPSLARLTAVELRKTTDTRSGRWLLILVALTAVAMMPVVLYTAPKGEQSLGEFFVAAQLGVGLLLPVLGILAVTTEWSQRTMLSTCLLVPDRHRVVAAKLLGGAVLGAGFALAGLAAAVLGRAAGGLLGRSGGGWTVEPSLVATVLLFAVASVLMGTAFGMLFMNTPLAVVLYFLLPTLWSTLGAMVGRLEGTAKWLDTHRTLDALTHPGVTSGEWARVAASLAVWLLLPLAAGTVRLARREVK